MVKVSKGQTDHIDQRQDGKEQYSDKWTAHQSHVETAVCKRLEVLNEVRNLLTRLFKSH